MRRSAIAVIGACALSPAAAQDFTFPQLDFVVANNQRLLDLTGFAPQRDFASYTFTVEWQNPLMNGAQSSQARFGLSTNFGATLINDAGSLVSPTFGASNTSMPTTLVFTGDFLGPSSPGFYNPFTDTVTPSMPALIDVSTGFFDIVAFQTQSGTSASWLATLTLHEPEPPETDPEDLGIVDVGYEGAVPVNGFRDFTQEQIEEGQTLFYTFTHPGGPITIDTDGSFFFIFDNPDDTILYLFDTAGDLIALNDDRGLDDFLSEIRLPDLPAGDYAVAVTGFPSSASGSDFVIDNSSESVGDVVVNVTLPRQPTAFTDLGVVAEAGQLVSLDTCGSDFDTELGLWDSKGTLIAENDDSISDPADLCGGLRQSSIGDRALDAGTYFAAVSGFLTNHFAGFEAIVEFDPDGQTESGNYELNINSTVDTGIIAVNEVKFFRFVVSEPSAPACPPDQNLDTQLDIDDFSSFVANFFAADTLADVNSDGQLDIDDFSSFVTQFFMPPPGCNP